MAQFDQPALWDYVMKITGEEKITFIGHSQGNSQLFAAITENPQYYKKHLKVFVALAPILKIKSVTS
jgi:poly(3-hydroxyalkanoate) synthetase